LSQLSVKVLAILGLDYETTVAQDDAGNPGKEVLSRIRNVNTWQDENNPSQRGFWLVSGTGADFEEGVEVDFSDIVLHNANRINLVYLEDRDGDGLYNREEYLLGTDTDSVDTDGDNLSDYDEAKTGWAVAVSGLPPYHLYSDPRFRDVDNDFLSDSTEFYLGTNPYMANTDGDDLADAHDSHPLSPPCMDATFLGLTAWWDGTAYTSSPVYKARDIMVAEPFESVASDGTMVGAGTIAQGEWTPVSVSFGGELMRIYVNGVKVIERSSASTWTSGLYKYRTTTNYLIRNTNPLLIGTDSSTSPVRPMTGTGAALFGRSDAGDRVAIPCPQVNCFPKAAVKLPSGSFSPGYNFLLDAYKVPRQIKFLDQLPQTPSGKVLKRKLRNPSP
jgi:hypothetical protein